MNVKTSNPQPQAVERINKQKDSENVTNLNGSEMSKNPKEKEQRVKIRNKNNKN